MSIIRDIRSAIDTRLDHLDARADALEAQLSGSREEALKRIEQQKESLIAALGRVEETVVSSAKTAAGDLRTAFDHLRVQLALGKAETGDLLTEQDQNIRHAIKSIEELLENAGEGVEDELSKRSAGFIRTANKLRAEFEAAELQFALLRAEHRDDVQTGKAVLRNNLDKLRTRMNTSGHQLEERFERFETEYSAGLAQIRKAFLELGKGK